ncbi:hypothetical protein [Streptomyces sp. NPDC001070]
MRGDPGRERVVTAGDFVGPGVLNSTTLGGAAFPGAPTGGEVLDATVAWYRGLLAGR